MGNLAFGSTLNPIQGKRERLAVSSSAVSFTPANYTVTYTPNQWTEIRRQAQGAMLQVSGTDGITYTVDGTTPVAGSVGKSLSAGDILYLDSYQKVQNFKAIRTGVDTSIDADFLFGN